MNTENLLKSEFGPAIATRITAVLRKEATKEEIREGMQEHADGEMKDILAVTDEPLASTDLKGSTYSSIFSAPDTLVIGDMVKVVAR
jgi:glyceraldehyde 3-phosphate dehydrogenase